MILRSITALALCCPLLSAQGPLETREITIVSTPYIPRLATAIHLDASLVEAAIVVRNANGEAVAGLRREDFEIRDEGKMREIRSFAVETGAHEAPGASAPPNAAASPKPRARWIALLFDDLNSNAAQLISARIAAQRLLKEGLQPADRISVFTTHGRQIVPFTADIDRIHAALNKLSPVNVLWQQTRATSRSTIAVIRDVVDHLAQFSGNRLLICASGGFQSDGLESEQSELIDRSLRAGVVIDSLDAKGLYVQEAPVMGLGASARSVTMQQNLGTGSQEASNDALSVLAHGTGGLFFHNNNDFSAGLREMMTPETTYLIGFAPDAVPDGKYHKLKVRVSAAGHYDVQARPGYVATPAVVKTETPPRKIDEAALANDSRTEPAATIGSAIQTAADGSQSFAAVLHIDLAHMAFREAFGIRNQRVVFIAILNDLQGNFVTATEYAINLALQQATYDKYAGGGFNATAILKAPKGYQMSCVEPPTSATAPSPRPRSTWKSRSRSDAPPIIAPPRSAQACCKHGLSMSLCYNRTLAWSRRSANTAKISSKSAG